MKLYDAISKAVLDKYEHEEYVPLHYYVYFEERFSGDLWISTLAICDVEINRSNKTYVEFDMDYDEGQEFRNIKVFMDYEILELVKNLIVKEGEHNDT